MKKRTQPTHKLFSFLTKNVIASLASARNLVISLLTLTVIFSIASCGVDLDSGDNVKTMAAGAYHTVALKNDGTLWAWGYNYYGQLGNDTIPTGTASYSAIPVQVLNPDHTPFTDVKTMAAGEYYTVALKNDGTLWAWGYNYYGQLGNGENGSGYNKSVPVQVKNSDNTPFTDVKTGISHTIAIDSDGKLWAWGYNASGQLGNGENGPGYYKSVPVQVKNSDNTPFTDVKTMAAGGSHTIAIDSDGKLWAWGLNNYGQLGNGESGTGKERNSPTQIGSAADWIAIFAGSSHTI
ncbi:MAG: hypothetical protein FWG92_07345, partial [Leptospirales bacterium]|nr:hypothetical protein [Leptospirales bacterium]